MLFLWCTSQIEITYCWQFLSAIILGEGFMLVLDEQKETMNTIVEKLDYVKECL